MSVSQRFPNLSWYSCACVVDRPRARGMVAEDGIEDCKCYSGVGTEVLLRRRSRMLDLIN